MTSECLNVCFRNALEPVSWITNKERFSFTKPSLHRMLKVKSLTVWYTNKGIHTCVVFEMRDYFKVWGRLFWRNPWYSVSNMSSKTKTKAIFFWARFMLMRPFSALHIHQGFVFLWVGGYEGHSSFIDSSTSGQEFCSGASNSDFDNVTFYTFQNPG